MVFPASFVADTFNWYQVAGEKSQKTKLSRFSSEFEMSDDTTVQRNSPEITNEKWNERERKKASEKIQLIFTALESCHKRMNDCNDANAFFLLSFLINHKNSKRR